MVAYRTLYQNNQIYCKCYAFRDLTLMKQEALSAKWLCFRVEPSSCTIEHQGKVTRDSTPHNVTMTSAGY